VVCGISYSTKVAANVNEVSWQASGVGETIELLDDPGCTSDVYRGIHPSSHCYDVRFDCITSLLVSTAPVANVGFHKCIRKRHNDCIAC
jgi:hypothetical protein